LDLIQHNRRAWNTLAGAGILWSQPVSSEIIHHARQGDWSVSLAGRVVPESWLGDIVGKDILCLASAGGQQAPIFAAAGANVTSFDISDEQLRRDRLVAQREGLSIRTEQGTMTDLSRFDNDFFDLIFLPVAVNAIPDVMPVWNECYRVLRNGGDFLAGFINPLVYLFEENDGSDPEVGLRVINQLPYSEFDSFSNEQRSDNIERGSLFLWSHSLEAVIGGQLRAGFVLVGFQEGNRTDARAPSINRFTTTYFSTWAKKDAGDQSSKVYGDA